MLPRSYPDGIHIAFDDHRLVNNAGLILPATLAQHLGLPQLVQQRLDLGDAPGRANTGDKIVTLVASALAGGDCIDDADVLRTGRTASALGCVVKAPSTLGTFLRSFRWGHVRQLDRVSRELLARAWAAGAGPGDVLMSRLREGRANTARAPPTSCVRWWAGCATEGPGGNSRCAPTAASTPTPWCPPAERRMSATPSPSASTPPAQSHRGHTRRCLDADSLLDGRRRRCGRDHLHPIPKRARRRTRAAHRPAGEANARFPTGPLRHLQLSRLYHRPGRGNPGTGGRPSPPRRDRECHPRPQVRRGVEPSPLGALRRQRCLAGRPGDRPQPGTLDGAGSVWVSRS